MNDTLPRDLGDGLALRHATPADADALSAFNGEVHAAPGQPSPHVAVSTWTRDLLTLPHPSFAPADFTIVEETSTGRIVSSLNLISQTWTYDGIPFGVGRPEVVGTAPDYRRRGLVREQFDLIHGWSAERGHLVQAITGIPNFYRQFGYEMAVNLGGSKVAYRTDLPERTDEEERFRVRPAEKTDVPFLAQTYHESTRRYLLASVRDDALWQCDLFGRSPASLVAHSINIVETIGGEPVGYVAHRHTLEGHRDILVRHFEVRLGVSWLEVTPVVLRYLRDTGKSLAEQEGKTDFERISFALGSEHPSYGVLEPIIARTFPPYAWYLRVPDVPAFLRAIAPVLEDRLAQSAAVGYTGSLKISRYVDGFELTFERGRLKEVSKWRPGGREGQSAAFPDLTFLHLLFGYRTMEELRHLFADCFVSAGEYRVVLNALFPKKASDVWPVE